MVEVAEIAVAHVIFDAAGARHQPRRYAVEQRRLAGARFPDNSQNLARPQIEAAVGAAAALAVEFRNAIDLETWCFAHSAASHTPTLFPAWTLPRQHRTRP